jgi:hypothetical protein
MHAKDTPFRLLIYEISNIIGAETPRAAAAPDLKIRPCQRLNADLGSPRRLPSPRSAASHLTTNFAGRTTGEGKSKKAKGKSEEAAGCS